MRASSPSLLLITDRRVAPVVASIRAALAGGGDNVGVLLRDKDLPRPERARLAEALLPLCEAAGAVLLVHGDVDLARSLGCGLHLPDGAAPRPPLPLVGVSRHSARGLSASRAFDYATLSPVLPSPGKGPALGWERFAGLARSAPLPCLALGGLGPAHAATARAHGAAGLAGVRGWLAADDPAGAVRSTREALRP